LNVSRDDYKSTLEVQTRIRKKIFGGKIFASEAIEKIRRRFYLHPPLENSPTLPKFFSGHLRDPPLMEVYGLQNNLRFSSSHFRSLGFWTRFVPPGTVCAGYQRLRFNVNVNVDSS
jgi:hypothetical protein